MNECMVAVGVLLVVVMTLHLYRVGHLDDKVRSLRRENERLRGWISANNLDKKRTQR